MLTPSNHYNQLRPEDRVTLASLRRHQPGAWVDSALFTGLLALIVVVPLPLGSQRNWAMALWFFVVMAMLMVKLLHVAVQDRGYRAVNQLRVPVALMLSYALLGAVQVLPLAGMLPGVDAASAAAHWPYVSVDIHQSKVFLLQSLTYAGIFALVGMVVRSEQRLRVLLYAIVMSGLIQAFLAIFLSSTNAVTKLFYFELTHSDAKGSFANRNNLAAYLELCLSVGVGLLVASMAEQRLAGKVAVGWKENINSLLGFLLSSKMIVRGMLIVMVIALVLTRSRMGNTAFFVSLLVGGGIVASVRKELRRTAGILVVSMLVIDLFIVGQWVGIEKVVDRISDTQLKTVVNEVHAVGAATARMQQSNTSNEESIEQRVEASRQAMAMVKDRPWLGFGAGTFYTSFLAYQSTDFAGYWNHPHNDFVEIAVDTGLIGLGLLASLACMVAWRALKQLRGHFRQVEFAAALGALLSLTCMLIHGAVDFGLQIPANSMLLCMILAGVYAGDERSGSSNSRKRRTSG